MKTILIYHLRECDKKDYRYFIYVLKHPHKPTDRNPRALQNTIQGLYLTTHLLLLIVELFLRQTQPEVQTDADGRIMRLGRNPSVYRSPVLLLSEGFPETPPPALPQSHLGAAGQWHDRAHARRCPGDVLRQIQPPCPVSCVRMEDLRGVGEGQCVPAVAPQHVDAAPQHGHRRLAAGPEQGGQERPLLAAWLKSLHVQDVKALNAVLVVIAAAQRINAVTERRHAVPAACQEHRWALHPRVTPAARLWVVAQHVTAIWTDLDVVAPRDVDQTVEHRACVSVGQPEIQ